MEEITLDDLRKYRALKQEIEAIRAEIRSIYEQSSKAQENIGGKSSVRTPGDPTARKAMQALERRETLERREDELKNLQIRIETYVDTMTNFHVAAIMRWHYFQGLSWKQTCSKVYGYPDPDICRMAVKRYFKKQEEKNEID